MTKTPTILFHSRTGLSALLAAINMSQDSPCYSQESLPRLMNQIKRPGQFLSIECTGTKLICLNSATVGKHVDKLLSTASMMWQGSPLEFRHVPEGLLSALRARIFCALPTQRWLIGPELRWAEEAVEWK